MKLIATIRIAPGNVGWYDATTGIHLTISRPTADVYEGMNLTNIKRGIQYKTITLLSGSLNEDASVKAKEVKENKQKNIVLNEEVKSVVETTEKSTKEVVEVIEEKVIDTAVEVEIKETKEIKEETKETKKKAAPRKKAATTKKKEDKEEK